MLEPFYFIYLCHSSQSLFTLHLSLCEKGLYSQLGIWSILCTPFVQHIYLFLLSWSSNTPCYCPQISLYSSPVCAINAQTFSFRYSHSLCLSSHHEKHLCAWYTAALCCRAMLVSAGFHGFLVFFFPCKLLWIVLVMCFRHGCIAIELTHLKRWCSLIWERKQVYWEDGNCCWRHNLINVLKCTS